MKSAILTVSSYASQKHSVLIDPGKGS